MDLDEDRALSMTAEARITIPGESVANATDWMRYARSLQCQSSLNRATRGHGTYVEEEAVLASVSGLVERVNKLVSVRALRSRCAKCSDSQISPSLISP